MAGRQVTNRSAPDRRSRSVPHYFPIGKAEETGMRIVVMGVGRIGGAIARDLVRSGAGQITAVDLSADALAPLAGEGIQIHRADLADRARVAAIAAEHDLVIGAGPASLGFATLKTVVDRGRNVVDISFFAEDPFILDELARERGAVAVVDAGVSPGLSNVLYGNAVASLGSVRRFVCYVGGLPAHPHGPMSYKAPFAPSDVIELYTRPARHVRDSVPRTDPALSLRVEMAFPNAGMLEAALTDGLRTMLRETDVSEMREMTLRYPGHFDQILLLRDLGFFDSSPVALGGQDVSPRAVTEHVLRSHWAFTPGEADVTLLQVEIDVDACGDTKRYVHHMIDRYDRATDTSSMARTTGHTCTAIASLVASGRYAQVGVSAPEDVGRTPGCCQLILSYLAERGVAVDVWEETIA
jgi:saccharopine dehydrogenase-like NADP-dependent oxidoreductase